MSDVDPAATRAAVRAVIAQVRALPVDCTALTGPVWFGDGWKQALDTVEEFADAWPDDGDDVPALLARVDEQAAVIARLRADLDAANARTAERCRELMAAERRVEQANAERDHAQAAVAGARVICDALRVYPDIGPSLDLIERALDGWTTAEDTASDEKPPETPAEPPAHPRVGSGVLGPQNAIRACSRGMNGPQATPGTRNPNTEPRKPPQGEPPR